MMLGATVLAAVPGGCNRPAQPPAPAPAAVHQCPVPVPVAVVYHAAQDRWEVVLADPDAAQTDLPATLPLQTVIDGRIVDGFVPSPAAFEQRHDSLRMAGHFPSSVRFQNGRWFVARMFTDMPEEPLLDEGAYPASVKKVDSHNRYEIFMPGMSILIDGPDGPKVTRHRRKGSP